MTGNGRVIGACSSGVVYHRVTVAGRVGPLGKWGEGRGAPRERGGGPLGKGGEGGP